MRKQRYIAALVGVAILGCGVAANQSSKQTLLGVSKQQVLIDAQHALALQGFDVEEVDLEKGELKSSWQKKTRRQVQYVVAVNQAVGDQAAAAVDAGPTETTEVVEIVVQVNTKEKIVGGWSEATPSTSARASNLLEDIVELAVSRFSAAPQALPKEKEAEEEKEETGPRIKCAATAECPAGMHCGTGYCVFECAMDSECEAGSGCDERGRCFVKPEPCPAPEASAEDEKDTEQEAKDEKEEKKESRKERRKSRKERERDDE